VKSNKKTDHLHFSVVNDALSCAYTLNDTLVFTESSKLMLNLNKLRKNRQDELQTIVAVHESGHAVLYGALMNKIAENVYSVSSDDDANGFVYANLNKDYFSKKELIPFAACMLGGLAAEELIFGDENMTTGSKSDIDKVTDLVFNALKSEGFGEAAISFARCSVQQMNAMHSMDEIENEALRLVQKAKQLALETLTKEKELLLVLSNYLSKNSSIDQYQLAVLFDMHAQTKIDKKEPTFYRDKLKLEMEKTLGNQSAVENLTNLLPLQLNKDTKND
jgi:ATP-dependent Zn protease